MQKESDNAIDQLEENGQRIKDMVEERLKNKTSESYREVGTKDVLVMIMSHVFHVSESTDDSTVISTAFTI